MPEYPFLDELFPESDRFTASDLSFPPSEKIPGNRIKITRKDHEDDKIIVEFYRRVRFWILDYARLFAEGYQLEDLSPDQRSHITVNSGFALLAVLNAVFDLMGRLVGDDDLTDSLGMKKHETKNFTNWEAENGDWDYRPSFKLTTSIGLHYFFDDCLPDDDLTPYEEFYIHVRSSIAHIVFPDAVVIHHNEKERPGLNQPLTVMKRENPNKPKDNEHPPTGTKEEGEEKSELILAIHRKLWYQRISERFDEYTACIRDPQNEADEKLRERFLKRIKWIGYS